jgi:hypothetical protein
MGGTCTSIRNLRNGYRTAVKKYKEKTTPSFTRPRDRRRYRLKPVKSSVADFILNKSKHSITPTGHVIFFPQNSCLIC